MAEEQNTTTLTLTFTEQLELQGTLLTRIGQIEKSLLLFSEGPVKDLLDHQLDTTKNILAKIDKTDRASVDRMLEALNNRK